MSQPASSLSPSPSLSRLPPVRLTLDLLRRLGLTGRGLVVMVPYVWLLLFFLIPFVIVAQDQLRRSR